MPSKLYIYLLSNQEPRIPSRWPSRNHVSKYGNGIPVRQAGAEGWADPEGAHRSGGEPTLCPIQLRKSVYHPNYIFIYFLIRSPQFRPAGWVAIMSLSMAMASLSGSRCWGVGRPWGCTPLGRGTYPLFYSIKEISVPPKLYIYLLSNQEPPIPSRWPSRNHVSKYGNGIPVRQPALRGGQTLRVYTAPGGNLPFATDLFLRISWILNLVGLSGIVMIVLNSLKVNKDWLNLRAGMSVQHD